jgi:hypothetical protein
MSGWSEHPAPPSVAEQLSSSQLSVEQQAQVAVLAERVYGHVLRVVDLDLLYGLEQVLWSELDRLKIRDNDGDLATALLSEALHRVGHAPDRHVDMIPEGIRPDEIVAAYYDEDCLLCRHELADIQSRTSGQQCDDLARHEDKEWRALQARERAKWRAEHADALRRFGLG